jgi:hypothetical protein
MRKDAGFAPAYIIPSADIVATFRAASQTPGRLNQSSKAYRMEDFLTSAHLGLRD